MNSEIFRGEEDIDKSKVFITDHAVKRFRERSAKNGFKIPEMPEDARSEIRNLLTDSTHINAIDAVAKVKSIIDHGESYFFRCQRWQFVLKRDRLNPNRFLMITVIYLTEKEYNMCFRHSKK